MGNLLPEETVIPGKGIYKTFWLPKWALCLIITIYGNGAIIHDNTLYI